MSSYLTLIIITLVIGGIAQGLIKSSYKKWDKVAAQSGISGAQAARQMLDANGLNHVSINQVGGQLTDHFDPRTNTISLSSGVYSGQSVSAVAVACHECGHAVQTARSYAPAKIRSAIVPVVSLASNLWIFLLIAGIFLAYVHLIYAAIIMFVAVLLFQLVTLPVEFDASKRGLEFIKSTGWLSQQQNGGAASVLRSAAMTYVAAALASILQLVYLLGFARD
jgi:Zn-dependent membrane protease YugP